METHPAFTNVVRGRVVSVGNERLPVVRGGGLAFGGTGAQADFPLAAAWAQTLTPRQMLDRLHQGVDLLASNRREKTDRHRSLRAAMDWSYQLLEPEQRRFFWESLAH